MDALELAKLVREYFKVTLNTDLFKLDIQKSTFDKTTKQWTVEVTVTPFYGPGKTYNLLINDQSGDITNIEAVSQPNQV